jgi:hypothetical protein
MLRKEELLYFVKNPPIVAKTLMLRQQLFCALAQFHFFEAFSEGQHCIPFLWH